MVTNFSVFQDFASIPFLDIYKCPKSIFGEWSWVKKLKVLYILTIFLLKEPPLEKVAPKANLRQDTYHHIT